MSSAYTFLHYFVSFLQRNLWISHRVLKQMQLQNFQAVHFSLRYAWKNFTAVSVLCLVFLESFCFRIFSKSPHLGKRISLFFVCCHFFPKDTWQWAVCNMKSNWLLRTCDLIVIGWHLTQNHVHFILTEYSFHFITHVIFQLSKILTSRN